MVEKFPSQYEHNQEGQEYPAQEILRRIDEIVESPELSPQEIQERCKGLIQELLDSLKQSFELHLSPDVSHIYSEMQREQLLARVESVAKVLECIAEHKPISVGNAEHHYANAVTPEPEGLRIAMAEADAIGPVRLLVGLDLKALIGFKTDHLEVVEIDESEFDHRDTGLRSSLCRHVVGEILPEDLRYMIMRIPRRYFPEESLTDTEKEQTSQFIFRGAKIPAGRKEEGEPV